MILILLFGKVKMKSFFGDDIEELAYFTVADQRTYEPVVGELTIYPCRELLLTNEVKDRARYLAAEFPALSEMCSKIAEGISVDGMESLIGLLNTELQSLIDFLPKEYEVILIDAPRIASRAMDGAINRWRLSISACLVRIIFTRAPTRCS